MKITGKEYRSHTDVLREMLMDSCLKAIAEDPNLCLWYEDLELLMPCVITIEQRDKYMEFFKPVKIDWDKYPSGVLVYGTGGDLHKSGIKFEDMFYDNTK